MSKRRAPTRREAVEIVLRQNGICPVCKAKLQPDNIQYDHISALVFTEDNDLSNFRAICVLCHKQKTKSDVKANAKVKRLEKKRLGTAKPKLRKTIQGAGFDKRFKKRIDGTMVERR